MNAQAATRRSGELLYLRRRIVNRVAIVLSCLAAVFGVFFLAWILWTTISKGIGSIGLALFADSVQECATTGGTP